MIESALSSFDVSTPRRRVAYVAHQLTLVHWRAIYRVDPESDARAFGDQLAARRGRHLRWTHCPTRACGATRISREVEGRH